MLIPVQLAVEDQLSQTVLIRLLNETGRFAVGRVFSKGGYGYLKRTIRGWNEAAKGCPFVVLTDLDEHECPATLLGSWLESQPRHPNLLLRVAVREVEAWLLADTANLARFLNLRDFVEPESVEAIPDPKQFLIDLAARSRQKDIRAQIVPRPGSTAHRALSTTTVSRASCRRLGTSARQRGERQVWRGPFAD